jgi:hypothetical protein
MTADLADDSKVIVPRRTEREFDFAGIPVRDPRGAATRQSAFAGFL